MSDNQVSAARERVLNAAERLFSERGYAAVTMRDIATTLGIRQASLYHHVPGGKEQLFIEVTERSFARHAAGLRSALEQAPADLREQLRAAAQWLLSQPPVDMARFFRSDVLAIGAEHEHRLVKVVYGALIMPIEELFEAAYQRGEIRLVDKKVSAILFLAAIESLHDIGRYSATPKPALGVDTVDLFLDGLRRR
ncbi:MAG: TetR/AcrR family transcriptional regulator [Chloroflexaceae bacterium]|nr:TetR/AcrR family transcriptional regulator [Chloroflexaceae bacterium]